ncbi:pentatricopeptide repeat-containing protein mitochondrial [Dorcoceras hygrometricum]|uniref:Pentatricopeptide repeat-containing protein mitochondrial n=1 Tax=Dorcoceras hygrometricum TaxID=472368 RepID=A0A2Z7B355_9LAMI|nr:pentatricopeptide repeat-containing protein mitochondrial [Dorcoceras hygrometricum]
MKQQSSAQPNHLTFPLIAKACAKLYNLAFSRIIHAHVAKTPYSVDIYVQTAFVDMYVKCNDLECAYTLFDEMSDRDVASWNAVIMGFAQVGSIDRVSSLFNRMRTEDSIPDAVTIMGLTQVVSGNKDRKLLSAVHCFGVKSGFEDDISVANTWISGYAKCGDLCSAEMVFHGLNLDSLTTVSWNAMLSGCSYVEDCMKSIGIYKRMLNIGHRPDLSTIINLLSSFSQPEWLCHGTLIHAHGFKIGCYEDVSLLNTLVSMYCKCGDIDSARCIFDNMKEKSRVTWTAMIGGYSKKADLDEALSLFRAMEIAGEEPDVVTVVHLTSVCAKVGALEVGKWIDDFTASNGFKGNVMVCNALLDMYAKCGSIQDAEELFLAMEEKTIVSWTTMIAGYGLNGKFQESLYLVDQMLKLGLEPNDATFLAVLQAFTHAGFLEEGWVFFEKMTKVYGLTPGLDHYACMADLIGRQGKIEEALKFIFQMPTKPDAGVWGALLWACKIHRNLKIAEYAARRLFELEPGAAAPYVEMANIYASAKEWDGFAAIRREMKSKQVIKSPGQSVIQMYGKFYSFTVEDRYHRDRYRIFEALDSLVLQLKDVIDLFPEIQSNASSRGTNMTL